MHVRICAMRNILLVFLLCFCCGCNFWFLKPKVVAVAEKLKAAADISVEVFDPDVLAKGGKVFVEPFKAGVDAEASVVLDHIAAMIVHGIGETIADVPRWRLAASGEDADMVIHGYIEKFQVPEKWWRIFPGAKKASLRVRGDIRSGRTGSVVALVSSWKSTKYSSQEIDKAAYEIGRDIVTGLFRK